MILSITSCGGISGLYAFTLVRVIMFFIDYVTVVIILSELSCIPIIPPSPEFVNTYTISASYSLSQYSIWSIYA